MQTKDLLIQTLEQIPEALVRQMIIALQWLQHHPSSPKNDREVPVLVNEQGETIAVVVPIAQWEKLTHSDTTRYLLSSETMKKRLIEAKQRQTGISLEAACERATQESEGVAIVRENQSDVLITQAEWESLIETAMLLQVPNLLQDVETARQEYLSGDTFSMEQVFE